MSQLHAHMHHTSIGSGGFCVSKAAGLGCGWSSVLPFTLLQLDLQAPRHPIQPVRTLSK